MEKSVSTSQPYIGSNTIKPQQKAGGKKMGKWLGKIPKDILISPGGVVLVLLALLIEIVDLIPLPLIDQIIEIPLEIIFIVFFKVITKLPWQNLLIPTLIERIPGINDVLPTWFLRLFM